MFSKVNMTRGNTAFYSDCGSFSSLSRYWVEVWEKENIRKEYIESTSFCFRFFWDCKGNTEPLKKAMEKAKQRGHKYV